MKNAEEPSGVGRLRSIAEIMSDYGQAERYPVTDLRNPRGFELDKNWLTIWWGDYEYNISCDRIDTPEKVLGWLHHMCEKNWRGTTPERISNLIDALAHRHGWQIHGM